MRYHRLMTFGKEVKSFLIVGILTVLIDFLVYSISGKYFFKTSLAKAFGFISGTIFSFFANRNITFRSQNNIWAHLSKFIFLYTGTLIANVMINNTILNFIPLFKFQIYFAFFIATSTSAILNFLGMKYFVFIKKKIN